MGMIPNPSSEAEVNERVGSARALTTQPGRRQLSDAVLPADALVAAARWRTLSSSSTAIPIAISSELPVGRLRWQGRRPARPPRLWRRGRPAVTTWWFRGPRRAPTFVVPSASTRCSERRSPISRSRSSRPAGVATAQRVASLLEPGAAGVRVGTRFVAAEEADAHPDYVTLLTAASRHDRSSPSRLRLAGQTSRTASCARRSRPPSVSTARWPERLASGRPLDLARYRPRYRSAARSPPWLYTQTNPSMPSHRSGPQATSSPSSQQTPCQYPADRTASLILIQRAPFAGHWQSFAVPSAGEANSLRRETVPRGAASHTTFAPD